MPSLPTYFPKGYVVAMARSMAGASGLARRGPHTDVGKVQSWRSPGVPPVFPPLLSHQQGRGAGVVKAAGLLHAGHLLRPGGGGVSTGSRAGGEGGQPVSAEGQGLPEQPRSGAEAGGPSQEGGRQ